MTKQPTEYEDQVAIFEWAARMEYKHPELWLLNGSLNGVRLTIGPAKKAKRAGMKAGYPDIFLPVSRRTNTPLGVYCGLFIELKRQKGGIVSEDQKKWIIELQEQGYFACVANGRHAAIKVILQYLEGEL